MAGLHIAFIVDEWKWGWLGGGQVSALDIAAIGEAEEV
jgi:hypothetical protein